MTMDLDEVEYDPNIIYWCDFCQEYFEVGQIVACENDIPACPKCKSLQLREIDLSQKECI